MTENPPKSQMVAELFPSFHDFKIKNNSHLGICLMRTMATMTASARLNKEGHNTKWYVNLIHMKKLFPNLPFLAIYPKYKWFENYTEYQPILAGCMDVCPEQTTIDGDFQNYQYFDDGINIHHTRNNLLRFSKHYIDQSVTPFMQSIIRRKGKHALLMYIDYPENDYRYIYNGNQWYDVYMKLSAGFAPVVLMTSRNYYNKVLKTKFENKFGQNLTLLLVDDHYNQLYIMSQFKRIFVCNTALGFIAGRYFNNAAITVDKWYKETFATHDRRRINLVKNMITIPMEYNERNYMKKSRYTEEYRNRIGVRLRSSEGIGSMLFTIMAGFYHSRRNDTDFICNGDTVPAHEPGFDIGSIFPNLPIHKGDKKILWDRKIYQHATPGKNTDIDVVPGCELNGYFKSLDCHKFSWEEWEDFHNLLKINDRISYKADEWYLDQTRKYSHDTKSIGIHVRRGDYQKLIDEGNPVFHILGKEYYKTAIERMKEEYKDSPLQFFIFYNPKDFTCDSDRLFIKWLTDECSKYGDVVDDNDNLTGPDTLCAMRLMRGLIMSNSNLSWWAAYMKIMLSKRTFIAPSKWYHDDYQYYPFIKDVKLLKSDWITVADQPLQS